jgi:AcrR family transcriptional regulator
MTQRDRRPYRMVARAEQVEKTRRAILDAMKAALRSSPYPDIRVADVAAAAGVSAQTVHTHFRTKDQLLLAAIAELGPEVLAMRGSPDPGDVAAIVRGIVRVYESTGDLNWSLLPLEADSPAIAAVLAMGRAGHRAWLEDAFAPLLPAATAARRRAVDALYVATDVGTWKLLRRDLDLSRHRTIAVIESLARGALAEPSK